MLKLATLKKLGSSSGQIDIEDITDGILKLPGNKYRIVLLTGSINFELKSEEEQDNLIDIFEGFLNSIGFSIQLLIRTREIDMDDYLKTLEEKEREERLFIYKRQLQSYRKFVSSLAASNRIMNRQFYIVIPLDNPKANQVSTIKDQLQLRAEIVSKNLMRLGISSRSLRSIEIIDLFYSFYSPVRSKQQNISELALGVINEEFVIKGKLK